MFCQACLRLYPAPLYGISARHFLYSLPAETGTPIISRGVWYNYCSPTFLPCPLKSGLGDCGPNSFSLLAFRNCYWSQCKHLSRWTKFMERGIAKILATPKRRSTKTLRPYLLPSSYIKRDSKDQGKPQAEVSQLYSSLPLFQVEVGITH